MTQRFSGGFKGYQLIAVFLVAVLIGGAAVVVSAFTDVASPTRTLEGVIELLQTLALLLVAAYMIQRPALFPVLRSAFGTDSENTAKRRVVSGLFEVVALVLGSIGVVGLVLFTEGARGARPGGTIGSLLNLDPAMWFNGPVSLGYLCLAVLCYLVGVGTR